MGNISDKKFTEQYAIYDEKEIMMIPENEKFENTNELKMISFVKNNFSQWSQNEIPE